MIEPFLHLPFKSTDAITISEGWVYSKEEQAIHGQTDHHAIDFSAIRGTPVLAVADGFALSSYQRVYKGYYQNKRVGWGFGNFVVIYHPKQNLFTLYGHLETIAKDIPFLPPMIYSEKLIDQVFALTKDQFLAKGKEIKAGEEIGEVGDSGLSWGYSEEPGHRPNPATHPSWDETHVHFALYSQENGVRRFIDPYDIYGEPSRYSINKKTGLWV